MLIMINMLFRGVTFNLGQNMNSSEMEIRWVTTTDLCSHFMEERCRKICQTEPNWSKLQVPRPRYIPTNPRWQPVGWVLLWWSSTWVRRSLYWPGMTSGTGPWWVLFVIMLLVIILATLLGHWSFSYEYVSCLCDIARIAFQSDANLHAIII